MLSPVGGLLPAVEQNVVATFPGAATGPTLVLSAHYDSATQFGDHFDWNRWGPAMAPASLLGAGAAALGLWRRRRFGRALPRALALALAPLVVLPFAAMAWFFTGGPLLRTPSPGALDNAGSVVVLLRLAERLAARPPTAAATVKLTFFAAEEERALGSWAYAAQPGLSTPLAVINLETLGTPEPVGYVPDEGFQLRRYSPSARLLRLVSDAAERLSLPPPAPVATPRAAVTDARSFLARGIPALTLIGPRGGAFPRELHSARDARDRVDLEALERAVDLLAEVVEQVDRDPRLLGERRG